MAKYSQEFMDKLHEVYPDDVDLHRLAENGETKVWSIIHRRFLPILELTSMVNREPLIRASTKDHLCL